MIKRSLHTAPGEYYHIYNRGAFKHILFEEPNDYVRFLFYLLYCQSPLLFTNISRYLKSYDSQTGFPVSHEETDALLAGRFVELTSFCVMPNHYHLLVRETRERGIPSYLQRVGTGYTKYFNIKYETSGRIFQGPYQLKHVADNDYLLYLSAYIHKNPAELRAWKGKEFAYPYSSLQDFTEANRWGGLLMSDIIATQFDATSKNSYKDFIKTSTAKMISEELGSAIDPTQK